MRNRGIGRHASSATYLIGILHGCLKTNTGYDEHIMVGWRRKADRRTSM